MKSTLACTHSGFFALRTALLPLGEFVHWAADLAAPEAAARGQGLEEALAADRQRLRDGLRQLVARPAVREALFVASPSLEEGIDHWLQDPQGQRGQKVERTLVRYFSRMAGRSTPFGLFAGCSVGRIGDSTGAPAVGVTIARPGEAPRTHSGRREAARRDRGGAAASGRGR